MKKTVFILDGLKSVYFSGRQRLSVAKFRRDWTWSICFHSRCLREERSKWKVKKKRSINGRWHFQILSGRRHRTEESKPKLIKMPLSISSWGKKKKTKLQNTGSLITLKRVGRASASLNASVNWVGKTTTPVVCAWEGSQRVGRLYCPERFPSLLISISRYVASTR